MGPLPNCCYQYLNDPGRQFLPLDNSTLLPGATFRPLLLQVRIRNGNGSECGYSQTYTRVKSYSSQSVAVGRDPSGARDHACLHCRVPRGFSNARSKNRFPSMLYMVKVGQQVHKVSFDPGAIFPERSMRKSLGTRLSWKERCADQAQGEDV